MLFPVSMTNWSRAEAWRSFDLGMLNLWLKEKIVLCLTRRKRDFVLGTTKKPTVYLASWARTWFLTSHLRFFSNIDMKPLMDHAKEHARIGR
ncbi:hypothetical protein C7I87_15525 [Mesorhizobium sp. SARCC-RB16n]|nr:hypothetical protein C7I87_15525 [Mesorhizobium sp. SARCC-RB16n]